MAFDVNKPTGVTPPVGPEVTEETNGPFEELKRSLRENEIKSIAQEKILTSILEWLVAVADSEPEKQRRLFLIKQIKITAALRRVVNTYAASRGEEYVLELPEILQKLDSVLEILNAIPVNTENE